MRILALCLAITPLLTSASPAGDILHAAKFPEGDCAWRVSFSLPHNRIAPKGGANPAKNPPHVKNIAIVRKGAWRRDLVTFSDGRTRQQWWSESPPVVLLEREGGQIAVVKSDAAKDRRYDASAVDWINAKNFAGMKPFQGKACQYYEMEIEEFVDEEKVTKTLKAWIDPKTHFPVAFDNGSSTVSLAFFSVPPTLKVPEKFSEALDKNADYYGSARKSGKR